VPDMVTSVVFLVHTNDPPVFEPAPQNGAEHTTAKVTSWSCAPAASRAALSADNFKSLVALSASAFRLRSSSNFFNLSASAASLAAFSLAALSAASLSLLA